MRQYLCGKFSGSEIHTWKGYSHRKISDVLQGFKPEDSLEFLYRFGIIGVYEMIHFIDY
jgi:hypothetical protein